MCIFIAVLDIVQYLLVVGGVFMSLNFVLHFLLMTILSYCNK